MLGVTVHQYRSWWDEAYLGLLHATSLTRLPNSLMSPINDDGTVVLHIAGPLRGSINNGFCLLRRGLSYQMGLMSVLHWRGWQARHGGVAEPKHETITR